MGVFDSMHRSIDSIRNWPGVRHVRRQAFEHRFRTERSTHLFRGVYGSFEEALADAPPTAPQGYDNSGSTDLYLGRMRAEDNDYPAFFWLADALRHGARSIVDLGGNIGFKYHAFASLTPPPQGLHWTVVDVSEVVRRGRELARAAPATEAVLEFTDDLTAIDGCDVLYTSGTLQYLPNSLAEMLVRLKRKPKRVVVNTTPLHPVRSFYTLNSIGTAYCPYRVQARTEFIDALTEVGYQLRHEWRNRGKSLTIPFADGCDIADYSGMCLDLA